MICLICQEKMFHFLNLHNFNLYYCNNCFHIHSDKNVNKYNNPNKININHTHDPHILFTQNKEVLYIKCSMMGDYFISNKLFPYYYQKSYFTTNSLNYLCKKYDYTINKIHKLNDHTYLFKIIHNNSNVRIDNLDLIEQQYTNILNELYCKETFLNYSIYFNIYKNSLQTLILKYKLQNYNIYLCHNNHINSKMIKILLSEILSISNITNTKYYIKYYDYNKQNLKDDDLNSKNIFLKFYNNKFFDIIQTKYNNSYFINTNLFFTSIY